MDWTHKLLNIVVSIIGVVALFNFYHHYKFWTQILSFTRRILKEEVSGKVVLITGASSGIGEHLAYEYARRGACLALVARRVARLQEVAAIAELIGSPEAISIPGDVSKVEDCQRFIEETVNHFGRLDHLVTKAGVTPVTMFEDVPDVTKLAPAMDINFWGQVYSAYFAIPHLKRTHGRIVAIASCALWLPAPRMSLYNASKAAIVTMFETLRVELAQNGIGITIASPGLIESEMTGGKFLTQKGELEVDKEMRDVQVSIMPLYSTSECARTIVEAACRGEKYMIEPAWYNAIYLWKMFCPEVIEWSNRFFMIPGKGRSQRDTVGKKLLDIVSTIKEWFFIPSLGTGHFPEVHLEDYQNFKPLLINKFADKE